MRRGLKDLEILNRYLLKKINGNIVKSLFGIFTYISALKRELTQLTDVALELQFRLDCIGHCYRLTHAI